MLLRILTDLMKYLACGIQLLADIYELVQTGMYSTKRALYYRHIALYKNQTTVDRLITMICQLLKKKRFALHVV